LFCWEHLFQVDPSIEVVWQGKSFELRFSLKLVSIEITTAHEDELGAEQLGNRFVELVKCLRQGGVGWSVGHLVCDASQLGAEWIQFWFHCWFYIGIN